MGTRNLTCVVDRYGNYKVAQYCQWDGYPSGQGATVYDFIQNWDRDEFEDALSKVYYLTPSIIQEYCEKLETDPRLDKVGTYAYDLVKEDYPQLHRDTGAKVLQWIVEQYRAGKWPIGLKSDLSFAADSLYCEFCYVIDLQKNELETLVGFNKSPLSEGERFAHMCRQHPGFYPVRSLKVYALDNLPTNKAVFVSDLEIAERELKGWD